MSTEVVTGKVRFSFVHVFELHKANENAKAKYSMQVIIPKSDTKTIGAINAAVEEAKQIGANKWGGKIPKTLKTPLRDGDDEDNDSLKGCYFLNCSNERRPGVVDENRNEILNAEDVYSGCYGRVHLKFYPFAASGNNGIAASLQNVQKLEDGERLGGSSMSIDAAFGGDDYDFLG